MTKIIVITKFPLRFTEVQLAALLLAQKYFNYNEFSTFKSEPNVVPFLHIEL